LKRRNKKNIYNFLEGKPLGRMMERWGIKKES
jgi:hypothetical protein